MGGRREQWETARYRQDLTGEGTDFIRVRMRVERGDLVRFMAQYEAVIAVRVYGVVRYDTAHGAPHRDTLDWQGRVRSKRMLAGFTFAEALDYAIDDIQSNWRGYRSEFQRRRP